ncbi:MAG: PhzF family phenazine biosynthesis protein [Phycisphaeraceae bacterium]|nr:PhzF family phenazine biosynthesis protein [Phycisphaeraceae bacterium]
MHLQFFQVDSFTRRVFHGNPAGVVHLESWLPDERMQQIAAEANLSETAFVVRTGGSGNGEARYHIRWFTPSVEVELCGHATLAAAHILWHHVGERAPRIVFDSKSGPLPVQREGDLTVLDFPSRPGEPIPVTDELAAAFGRRPTEAFKSRDIMAVFETKREVHEMLPDMSRVAAFDATCIIATAPGAGHDFVSRVFAPRVGIPEDPVTGSAHCTLAPYWAKRLGKSKVTGHQVSRRGGELFCEVAGDRVKIGGHCVMYLEGRICVS